MEGEENGMNPYTEDHPVLDNVTIISQKIPPVLWGPGCPGCKTA